MYSKELNIALEATILAVELCRRVQSGLDLQSLEKHDKSPVTIADFGSQAIIAKALSEAFPNIPLIAEEDSAALRLAENSSCLKKMVGEVRHTLSDESLSEDTICQWIDHGSASEYSDLFWTLDPIDGTKGFLRGQQYAIALALVKDGVPVCATLACPNLPNSDGSVGAIFTANGDLGQCLQTGSSVSLPISVSKEASLAKSRFCESVESAHSDHSQSQAIAQKLGIGGQSVRMDSQAKYAAVARGDAEFYLRLPTRKGYVERIWDHAAGYAILKAAGGTITDVDGRALDFRCGMGLENNRGVVATHGIAHTALIDTIAETS